LIVKNNSNKEGTLINAKKPGQPAFGSGLPGSSYSYCILKKPMSNKAL